MSTQSDFLTLRSHLEQVIVGQKTLLDRLLTGILTGGHILLEGPPGLAKTTAVTTLASGIHASFQRIQFTPDLMPGDLTGTDIFDPAEKAFRFIEGPLFHEIVLADEINRAPPRVQSALLEAMQEHQISVGGNTRKLPELFIVMATQNPLEQSGTFPLPEAQLDRFLFHVELTYPTADEELEILQRDRQKHYPEPESIQQEAAQQSTIKPETVLSARHEIADVFIADMLERYVVELVGATRNLGSINNNWADYLLAGASPRASIALLRASAALAWMRGRDNVIPEDIIETAPDVLRHRIILDYSARAAGISRNEIIKGIIDTVPVP